MLHNPFIETEARAHDAIDSRVGEMTLVAKLTSDRVAMIKGVVALGLFALAVTTPGLLSSTSMRSLLTTMSFVG